MTTIPGNHDALDWSGPYAAECGELRLVVCDTTIRGRDDGHLDLDWLEAQLRGDGPTVVAIHHPSLVVTTSPSTNLQAKLEIGTPGFTIVPEPHAFLVHTADVAHVQPV